MDDIFSSFLFTWIIIVCRLTTQFFYSVVCFLNFKTWWKYFLINKMSSGAVAQYLFEMSAFNVKFSFYYKTTYVIMITKMTIRSLRRSSDIRHLRQTRQNHTTNKCEQVNNLNFYVNHTSRPSEWIFFYENFSVYTTNHKTSRTSE